MWKSGTEHLRSIKLNLTIISMSVSISSCQPIDTYLDNYYLSFFCYFDIVTRNHSFHIHRLPRFQYSFIF